MNLKYYLRGLGIGIVVTAIIMGIAFGGKEQELSNEEIKERARALGMTEESTVLADAAGSLQAELQKEQEEAPTPTSEPAPSATPEAVSTPSATPAATSTPAASATPTADSTPSIAPTPAQQEELSVEPTPMATIIPTSVHAPSATKAPSTPKPTEADGDIQNVETVTIQVNSGDSSFAVSEKLEQAGLVSSATEFDLYLCENGYDKRLNVGTFEIPANADNEQIARILARL